MQSWQDTEGEISPVVTGCQALAEKAKNTRRHWRRLVREKKAKRFPESERLPVQLLLLAWGMLPTLGGLLGERIRASRKQRRERVSALRAKLGHRWRLHPAMLLCGGCGDTGGEPQIDKTGHLERAYDFGLRLYEN